MKSKIIKAAAAIAAAIKTTGIIYTGYEDVKQDQQRRARIESSINAAEAHKIDIPNIDIIDGYNLENNKYIIFDMIQNNDIPAAEKIKRADNTHNTYYNLLINGKHKILILQGIDAEQYPALLIDADQIPPNKIIDNINVWAYGKSGAAVQI